MKELHAHDAIAPLEQGSAFLASESSPILLGLAMLLVVLFNHAVFIEAVTSLHNGRTVPLLEQNRSLLSRCFLYISIALLVLSHLVEISLWGIALVLAGLVSNFYEAAFFSGSTYTTLGYGNELLPGSWDSITVIIALSGMFSIAWTTSALISMLAVFHPTKIRTSRRASHE